MVGCRSLLASLVALLIAGGCGYSTRRLTAFPTARTVAVKPFTNTTYRRDLGLRLTQAVVEEIRKRTSHAVGSPETADLVVQGDFTANETVEGLDDLRNPIIQRLTGSLNVQIIERATGKVVRNQSFFASSEFLPSDQGDTLDGRGTDELDAAHGPAGCADVRSAHAANRIGQQSVGRPSEPTRLPLAKEAQSNPPRRSIFGPEALIGSVPSPRRPMDRG